MDNNLQTSHSMQAQLDDALSRLEMQALIPYVPGELRAWMTGVRELVTEVRTLTDQWMQSDHKQTVDAILTNSIELAPRVEQLSLENEHLLTALEKLERISAEVAKNAREGEEAEQFYLPARSKLAEAGLAFVLLARKQKAALETWLDESLNRVDGGGAGGD